MNKLLILIFLLYPGVLHASEFGIKSDSSEAYVEDLTDLLTLRLYTLTKYNSLEIIRPELKQSLVLRPNGNTNLGIGFNYKFLGFGVAFGRALSESSIREKGLTQRFDVQASYYGTLIGMDGFIQGYQGYYQANPNDFVAWNQNNFPQVRDLKVFSMGGNAFYLFNRDQFSYRAAYLRNEIQRRSAGSLSAGIFFYHDMVRSENGFIPSEMPDSIRQDFDLKAFDATSVGLSVGYQHTFVIRKNFYINFQLTPGLGYRRLNAKSLTDNSSDVHELAWQVTGRAALGYEFKHNIYIGAMASTILRSITYKGYEVDLGTEQFRVILGKRLDVSRR